MNSFSWHLDSRTKSKILTNSSSKKLSVAKNRWPLMVPQKKSINVYAVYLILNKPPLIFVFLFFFSHSRTAHHQVGITHIDGLSLHHAIKQQQKKRLSKFIFKNISIILSFSLKLNFPCRMCSLLLFVLSSPSKSSTIDWEAWMNKKSFFFYIFCRWTAKFSSHIHKTKRNEELSSVQIFSN